MVIDALERPGSAEAASAPASAEAVRAMVARLTDAEVRALLLERLDAVVGAQDPARAEGGLGRALATSADALAASVAGAIARVPNIPAGAAEGFARFWAPRGWWGTLHLLAVGLAALGAGHIAERAVRRWWRRLETPPAEARLGATLGFLLERLALEAAGLAALLAAARAVIAVAHPPEPISDLILTFFLFLPVLYVGAAAAAGRFLLAPDEPGVRLLDVDDADARFLQRAVVIFAGLVGFRAYVLSFLGGHGVDLASMRLGFWLTLLVHGWLFYAAWRARDALSGMLADAHAAGDEAQVARAYPWAAMALIALFWAITEIFTGLGFWPLLDERLPLTLAALIFAPVADKGIRGLAAHLSPDPGGPPDALAARAAERVRRGLRRMGRVALGGALMLALVDLWNVDFSEAAMGAAPARVSAAAVHALGVAAFGWLAFEGVTLWITRRILAETPAPATEDEEQGGEGGGAGGSRLYTVLPLLLRVAQAVILLATTLEALRALGVGVGPLLAGLGVLGLAIGFGAQKLVADVVSGVFFLIDDAFRVGEYVEIEDTVGTVERISIRSLQLRHHLGAVHTIPFGDVARLTNYSRDWVIMKLRFTVPFDTDLDLVKSIFKQIGKDMADDPDFASDFLQPFKSQGVLEVNDVGMVVRGKFMARPGRQWGLRKEIFARVQRAFEAQGVQFARREVRVRIDGEAHPVPKPIREAALAAAQAHLDEDLVEPESAKD
ncbi:mechanosensitive ion channel family protein [Rubrimonas cliftonensis]|uniref:Small-conductance mechanosensitive channel n=1 Tax=Rubrimonas cliftonensis TaxID=89524 RepID=A0A1H4E7T7_9RHOB|nr:mechanosensitive ion channel family protein [Rubrimonas cliftonensis]SEA81105.1 Small-conductance mechanosensitive channel [Rubrimonas cliftonensis]